MPLVRNPLLGPPDLEEKPGSEIGTSRPLPMGSDWATFLDEAETTPDLIFPKSIQTYHAMRTDSQIDALHIGTVSPIKEFRWSIDPNGTKASLAENAAADLGLPLKGQEDEDIPRARNKFTWDDFLADALLAPLYGFFDFEAAGSIVEGREWRLDKLAPRHPRLTEAFREDDTGELTAIRQRVAGPKTAGLGMPEPIPADRLVRFVWRGEAGSHVGRSMLRSMFREWAVKDRTMRIAAINLQRAGGVPVVEGAQGMSDDQLKDLAQLARQFKVAEGGGGAIPFGTKLNLVGGSVPDAISLLKYCDEAMARIWALMLVQLGMSATGNRALGAEFAIYAARAQRAWAKWIKASVDSLLDRYVEWNDPFQTHAPLVCFEQAKPDQLSLADLVALTEAGLITADPELEEWIRSEGGLPEKPEEEETTETPVPVVVGPDGKPIAAPPQMGPDGKPLPTPKLPSPAIEPTSQAPTFARGGATAHPLGVEREYGGVRASLTLPPRDLRRPPSANEIRAAVDFRGLDTAHSNTLVSLQQAWLKDVLPEQIKAMGDQIRMLTGDLTKTAILNVQAPALGGELLQSHLVEAAVSGATAAKREMMAQGKPAEHVVRVPDTPAAVAPRVIDQAAALTRLNANAVSLAAQRKAASLVSEGGRSKAEVAAAMEDHLKGQKHVWEREQLRGAVTMAQNQGRIGAFESQPDAAEATYEASELLDDATCDPCAAIDGTVFDSLEEATEAYAGGGYVDCEGGPNCRGTLVAIYPEQNPESGPGPLAEPEGGPYIQPEPGRELETPGVEVPPVEVPPEVEAPSEPATPRFRQYEAQAEAHRAAGNLSAAEEALRVASNAHASEVARDVREGRSIRDRGRLGEILRERRANLLDVEQAKLDREAAKPNGGPDHDGKSFGSAAYEATWQEPLSTGTMGPMRGLDGGGGINTTYKSDVDGTTVFVKPEGGMNGTSAGRPQVEGGRDLIHEQAAYAIAQRMGVPVPTTIVRDVPDHGPSLVIRGIEKSVSGKTEAVGGYDAQDVHGIALFDSVIGNTDRHWGNVQLTKLLPDDANRKNVAGELQAEKTRIRRVWPIDHGLAWPNLEGGGRIGNFQAIELANGREALTRISKREIRVLNGLKAPEVEAELRQIGLNDGEIARFRERLDRLTQYERIESPDVLFGGGMPIASRG